MAFVLKLLYVVEFRKERWIPNTQLSVLTDAEVLAAGRSQWVWNQHGYWLKGHDTGSLHNRVPSPVLTWALQPGDRVLQVIPIRFKQEPDNGRLISAMWESPTVEDPRTGRTAVVEAKTRANHYRGLGDDSDLPEIVDAVRQQVAFYFSGDYRDSQCSLSLRPIEGEEGGFETPENTLAADEAFAFTGQL
jgi:hypothetical protein